MEDEGGISPVEAGGFFLLELRVDEILYIFGKRNYRLGKIESNYQILI